MPLQMMSPTHMVSDSSKGNTALGLPADVSLEKQRLRGAWAYVFRHRALGELGRILLQELGDGRCHISCEVVGDPADPMTAQRLAIFKPLALALTCQMEAPHSLTMPGIGEPLQSRAKKNKNLVQKAYWTSSNLLNQPLCRSRRSKLMLSRSNASSGALALRRGGPLRCPRRGVLVRRTDL
jgi:hypothetical protein